MNWLMVWMLMNVSPGLVPEVPAIGPVQEKAVPARLLPVTLPEKPVTCLPTMAHSAALLEAAYRPDTTTLQSPLSARQPTLDIFHFDRSLGTLKWAKPAQLGPQRLQNVLQLCPK